jgi:hypothetical protein
MAGDEAFYRAAERRMEWLIAGIGAVATAAVAFVWGGRAAAGLAAGAILSWVNYRWMKQGVDTLARLATTQVGTQRAQVPTSVYLKFLGRYALLIVAAYAILRLFRRSPPPDASS